MADYNGVFFKSLGCKIKIIVNEFMSYNVFLFVKCKTNDLTRMVLNFYIPSKFQM